jgi:hypothetical protein
MGPMGIAMLVGAGLGALKSNEERSMWADQQRAEAEKTRYAPWTGQWGQNLPGPTGDMGNIMAGTMAGAAIGQQMDSPSPSDNTDTTVTEDMNIVDDTRPSDNYYKMQRSNMDGRDPFLDFLDKRYPTLNAH